MGHLSFETRFRFPTGHFLRLLLIALLTHLLIGVHLSPCLAQTTAKIDFAKQIQPIFEKHCIECHGDSEPEGGLRLTQRDGAFVDGDSGSAVIVARHPDRSGLFVRISSKDKAERMPPDGGLTDKEIKLIQRWISEGADWPKENSTRQHWAYKPVRDVVPPKNVNLSKSANHIDAFVIARLKERGLAPSHRATPAKLIRRVYLALTGIPPTPAEVAKFVADPSPKAYEKMVDQLLASPRFGEHWARPWLDLARYADSNGFQADQLRESWAYRDWVIRAMNRDLPFDQFAIEQLAGDLIPNATVDQKIATGFHRAAACNVEAGVHPEQNRINQIFDRVNTTGTAFLGMTIECAQCHNHKYDPITQDEYYQMFSFFNNTPLEVKLVSGVRYDFYGPSMELPLSAEKVAARNKLNSEIEAVKNRMKVIQVRDAALQADWEKKLRQQLKIEPNWKPLEITSIETSGGEQNKKLDDGSVLISGSLPGTSVYTVTGKSSVKKLTGIKIETLTDESLPGTGPGRGDVKRPNFILSEFSLETRSKNRWLKQSFEAAFADFSQNRWPVNAAIDGKRNTGWAIAPQFFKPHWAVFELKKPIDPNATLRFKLDQNYGRGRTIGRFRILVSSDDLAVYRVPADIRRIVNLKKRNKKQSKRLSDYYNATNVEFVKLNRQLKKLQRSLNAIKPESTLVMVEMNKPRETRKLIRGEYLNPGKKVEPGVPAVLNSFAKDLPRNRLGFAKWLAAAENPLFARVAVNRWWAQLFGNGLVESLEDFGVQSQTPSHPELLDWLARQLVENKFSRKKIIRTVVLSKMFQQSAVFRPSSRTNDPKNRWLSRGPRMRMSAEMIRDNALVVSGLLENKIGGKPVMPYQPNRIWRAVGRNAPQWVETTGRDRFRRGIYVVWRRAAPYPSFVNFDAPDRAACVVSRSRTNTPLQALTLLNDQAFFEMALGLASRTITENKSSTLREKIKSMMARSVSRTPEADEVEILVRLFEKQKSHFGANPKLATQLIDAIRHVDAPAKISKPELAAWVMVANAILNLDETINY